MKYWCRNKDRNFRDLTFLGQYVELYISNSTIIN